MKKRLGTIAAAAILSLANIAHAEPADFEQWVAGFRAEASAAGISQSVLDDALNNLSINTRVYELNDNQPEFSRGIWDYLDSAVSATRVANGRTKYQENRALLTLIDQAYGVDAEIIMAIWGLESSYGAIMGNYDAIQALATLAFEGRRTGYGRSQLIGALKIIQHGYANRGDLKGSWAGAMGHTQFIPTTYLAYAIDHDGDGKRDIWNNLGDVFASTANYLSVSGFRGNEAWGIEVRLPTDFDYALADTSIKKAVVEWAATGLSSIRGPSLVDGFDPNIRGRLIIPAGASGPAFLVFENFEAILKYNRSTAYALAVSLLSEEIAGRSGAVVAAWPRDDRPLSLSERKDLQQALKDRGYNPGPVDGIIGAGTKKALRSFQQSVGIPADGYASAKVLEALK
ncbi:lytic murein transglycosylase [Hyphococcus lacteus]|uniref:Lytic murein transglycosylase n=1 Tax=Hyphococcus lacteus TaxID=3143536 RepID=A0ABV3Z3R3_9PROT